MSENDRIIRVHIFGEEYPVKGEFENDAEAEIFRKHVLEVARYVDKRMHEVSERSANRSPKNIAVLAALNIADELMKLKEENEAQISSFCQKADDLADLIDERLLSVSSG
jgi:cell division protein ZapA